MNASHCTTRRLTTLATLMTGLLGSGASWAALENGSTLNIGTGSNFTMEVSPGFHLPTNITGLYGITLGITQAASGSHSGAPGTVAGENPNIDNPWGFFGNTGMHYTSSASNVLSASGNTATVDLSGWGVTWNGIAAIPMGSGAWGTNANGVADIVCGVDCGDGDTYTLTYTATVPLGDPSGFGGVAYGLNLTGTITGRTAPVAVDDSTTTGINLPVTIDVLSNDTDVNRNIDPTTVVATNGSNGTTSVDAVTGEVTYTPAFGSTGTDTFTYTVRDTSALISNSATVTVTVSAAPPPIANADTASTRVNTPVDIDVTDNDTDADGTVDVTTVTIDSDVTNGTTSVNTTTGVVTYTPNASFTGADTFTYNVQDNDGQTSAAPATVTITVVPNSVPVASNDNATTSADTAVEINVTANDTDTDGTVDVTTVTIASAPSNGTTSVNTTTGLITYTPNPGFTGTDTFTYTVDDNDGDTSGPASVSVTVSSGGASAMPANATLTIDSGSNFTMEVSPGFHLPTAITGFQGLKTFVAQAASGSHTGAPGTAAGETPGIDNPWGFFGNTGMHGTLTPARVLSATGNVATLDMSGWFVTWNGIPVIPMGNGAWGTNANGVADIVCGADCGEGDTYTLTYTATVPVGDPSGFGNVAYGLNLQGTIRVIDPVEASGTGTPVLGDGSEGGTAGSGYQVALASLPDDPDFDGVGAVFDFSVSGLGVGGTAVVTLNLGQAIPAGAVYRKYTAAMGWSTFDTSGSDTIESGTAVGGDCAAATYSTGLTAGHDCIRLTIVDGGSNDGDRSLNGTVLDPGVVAVPAAAPFVDTRTSGSSGGCTLAARPASAGSVWPWPAWRSCAGALPEIGRQDADGGTRARPSGRAFLCAYIQRRESRDRCA